MSEFPHRRPVGALGAKPQLPRYSWASTVLRPPPLPPPFPPKRIVMPQLPGAMAPAPFRTRSAKRLSRRALNRAHMSSSLWMRLSCTPTGEQTLSRCRAPAEATSRGARASTPPSPPTDHAAGCPPPDHLVKLIADLVKQTGKGGDLGLRNCTVQRRQQRSAVARAALTTTHTPSTSSRPPRRVWMLP